jgi:DMSO/TMAO reductase YedYZ molybdopterin-dependent catalytic subunit
MPEDERGLPERAREAAPGADAGAGQRAPGVAPEPPPADAAPGRAEERGSAPVAGPAPERAEEPAPEPVPAPAPAPERAPEPARAPRRRPWGAALAERPETPIEVPRRALASRSRRDFLLLAAGAVASVVGGWWLLPDRARSRLAPGALAGRLDAWLGRAGLTRERRERVLNRALEFDDDVAEAMFSERRAVRTYRRSDVTHLRNNYNGRTPGPEYLPTWTLRVSGLASGRLERLGLEALLARFAHREQVTRLVCVEGWSAIAWWGGLRFADFLAAFPPAPGARWAALRSAVNLDSAGRPDPYYVSIDLETARHPQTLLATHKDGKPLPLEHGAPLRLVAPMKLGLKNIKAITEIAYSAARPPDYWNQRGYSEYDGL